MKRADLIPKFDEMMCEMIQAIKELGGSGTVKEIVEKTLAILQLPQEIQDIPHKTGGRTEIEYRLAWTRTYLKKVGILENSSRGIWVLTAQGREMQKIDPREVVQQVRNTAKIKAENQSNVADIDRLEEDGVDVPDEAQSWRETLKNVLYNIRPDAFERLTQRLLRESGFTQVEVTGKTGDGGIDGKGTVKLNGIVSFQMLFQCKRYVGSVSAGEVRDFRGAMQGRADKGLFITTGKFSAAAVAEANREGVTPIDLIDGEDLVERLKELRLGVFPVNDYRVDEGWFYAL